MDINVKDRVSWKPEFEVRQFGIVIKRDHLRNGGNKYAVRDAEGNIHYLSKVTRECG